MRNLLQFALLFVAFWGIFTSCTSKEASSARPNIIYIMLDDLGYADLSCYGQKRYTTPNFDAFAEEGILFTNAYAAAPICTPSRVAFMTGQYPARHAVGLREPLTMSPEDRHLGLSTELPTVSSLLKSNGYETALFGKWHLGIDEKFLPAHHGFDHFFGILSGAADYIDHQVVNRYGGTLVKESLPPVLYQDRQPVERSGYLTDLITQAAIRFILKEHQKPFFISLQYTAPHWPWQSADSKPSADTIAYFNSGSPAIYAAMVTRLDQNFGELLQAIEAAGLKENTVIIVTSDNGGDRLSDVHPYKGAKSSLWEGGIRVPAFVRWPGVITPGSNSPLPVITMDWTATILAIAHIKQLDQYNLDGISLLSTFSDPDLPLERTFYWRISNRSQEQAFRKGKWKYLQTSAGEFLFDLASDPTENRDLKQQNQPVFEQLKAELQQIDKEMLPPLILAKPENHPPK